MKQRILELRTEGKSYAEISAITGLSNGTIGWHLNKGKNAVFNSFDKDSLPLMQKDYNEGLSVAAISVKYNCNKSTLKTYLNTTRKPKEDKSIRNAKSVIAVSKRRVKLKELAVDYKGGKCTICGYNKCIDALDFHHLNPKEKDFTIAAKGYTRSWEKVKIELDKCILVCANCHREIHSNKTGS